MLGSAAEPKLFVWWLFRPVQIQGTDKRISSCVVRHSAGTKGTRFSLGVIPGNNIREKKSTIPTWTLEPLTALTTVLFLEPTLPQGLCSYRSLCRGISLQMFPWCSLTNILTAEGWNVSPRLSRNLYKTAPTPTSWHCLRHVLLYLYTDSSHVIMCLLSPPKPPCQLPEYKLPGSDFVDCSTSRTQNDISSHKKASALFTYFLVEIVRFCYQLTILYIDENTSPQDHKKSNKKMMCFLWPRRRQL